MSLRQKLLILAFQHSIRHYRRTARLYQTLAGYESNASSRATLLTLSRTAEMNARIDIAGLAIFHEPVPIDRNTTISYFWDWLLLHCNIRITLAWLGWVEQNYAWLIEVLHNKYNKKVS